jgi:2'-5' RNA ligase
LRAFIALELTEPVRTALTRLTAEWQQLGAQVSWVRAENLHLTLVFLGEIEVRRLGMACRQMDAAALDVSSFALTASGTGVFGSPASPRVLWSGFAETPAPLTTLQQRLTVGLADRGFKVSRKEFRPHVTLGRVRSRRRVGPLTAAVGSANNTIFGVVPVRRVVLMQTLLSPQGARYNLLHESRLQANEA